MVPSTASGVSERTLTLTLNGSGKASFKVDSSRETSRLTLEYHWHGALRFDVAVPVLKDPRHRRLSVTSVGTLVASWTGQYTSKGGSPSTCRYRGTNVKSNVTARLGRGTAGNTLELTLHPRGTGGFFSDKGRGAVVLCTSGYEQSAPLHFAPSWFFRDNLQDHGRLSSDTAIIDLPSTLLPDGLATVAFPNERGRSDSVALGHFAWDNRAQTAVRAR